MFDVYCSKLTVVYPQLHNQSSTWQFCVNSCMLCLNYLLVQYSGIDLDEAGVVARLGQHAEKFGCMRCALCCLEFCQHQVQPAQIACRMSPHRLICHWQWAQQRLHGSHQVFNVLHNISGRISKAGESGQQLRDVAVLRRCSTHQSDPRGDLSLTYLVKVRDLTQLQPDPAHRSGEEVGGYMVHKVDIGPLSSCVQYLQHRKRLPSHACVYCIVLALSKIP